MEQHPIPQNVTSFQFKLVGDITLKQFAYLAANLLVAYLVTKISFVPGIISYPLAGLFVFLGIGLAFIPVAERPLDRWLAAFFKRIYSPTYFLYQKHNKPPLVLTDVLAPTPVEMPATVKPVSQTDSQEFVTSLPTTNKPLNDAPILFKNKPQYNKPNPVPQPKVPPPTPIPPQKINNWTMGAPKVVKKPLYPPLPQQSITGKKIVFEQKPETTKPSQQIKTQEVNKIKENYQKAALKLSDQINSLQNELKEGTIAKERFIELQQVLGQLSAEKENMSREIVALQKQLAENLTSPIEKPNVYADTKKDTRTTVKIMTRDVASQSGIPKLTNQPNVVTGIIKDSQGALLPNIIITIRDKESVPVRAFKTNRLGQFAASTPLPSGTYIIEAEDPKKSYQFHRIEISLSDQILPPLEISAVSEKDILRQKLSQELFGGNKI